MLRYREGEPLVELVQHLAAATSGAEEAGAPSSAEGAAAAAAANGTTATDGGAAGATTTTAAAPPPPPLQLPRVEVRVPADAASNQNRQVRARQLWGTDVYTHDSDVVAVLMHQVREEREERRTSFFFFRFFFYLFRFFFFFSSLTFFLSFFFFSASFPLFFFFFLFTKQKNIKGILLARPRVPAAAARRGQGRAPRPPSAEEIRRLFEELRPLSRLGERARRRRRR